MSDSVHFRVFACCKRFDGTVNDTAAQQVNLPLRNKVKERGIVAWHSQGKSFTRSIFPCRSGGCTGWPGFKRECKREQFSAP